MSKEIFLVTVKTWSTNYEILDNEYPEKIISMGLLPEKVSKIICGLAPRHIWLAEKLKKGFPELSPICGNINWLELNLKFPYLPKFRKIEIGEKIKLLELLPNDSVIVSDHDFIESFGAKPGNVVKIIYNENANKTESEVSFKIEITSL